MIRKATILLASVLVPALAHAQALPAASLPLSGREQIGCVQPPPGATGASTRGCTPVLIAQFANPTSILAFGGVGNGSTPNDGPFARAITAGVSTLYFPAGKYLFSSALTIPVTSNGIAIVGDGQKVTTLYWPGGGGLRVTMADANTKSVLVRDLSITTGSHGTGTGLYIDQTVGTGNPAYGLPVTVQNVSVHGDDGCAGTDSWAVAEHYTSITNGAVINPFLCSDNTAIDGLGIWEDSIDGSHIGAPLNIIGGSILLFSEGFRYGAFAQGVSISQVNFTGDNTCINVPSGESSQGLDGLTVSNGQLDCVGGILVNSFLPNLVVSGEIINVEPVNNAFGIDYEVSSQGAITGTSIIEQGSASGQNGIVVGANAGGTSTSGLKLVIDGDTIAGMSGTGIILKSGSANVQLGRIAYANNGANVSDGGTNNFNNDAIALSQVLASNTALTASFANMVTTSTPPTAGTWEVDADVQFSSSSLNDNVVCQLGDGTNWPVNFLQTISTASGLFGRHLHYEAVTPAGAFALQCRGTTSGSVLKNPGSLTGVGTEIYAYRRAP